MNNRIGNSNNLGKHEPYGNRELKYYKDIYGNDVRLMTSKERNIVNKSLIISSVFIVVLLCGFFYKAYLVKKEVSERTKLYLTSGESILEGKDIVNAGGVIVSEDEEVVAVEDDGTIIAKNSGTTNVTVYKNIDESDLYSTNIKNDKDLSIYDQYNALGVEGEFTFEVTVQQSVTGVSLGMAVVNMNVGETNKLDVNVFPHASYNKDVVWTSSNTNVAVVDSKGVVTARGVGNATITVTTKDGSFRDSTLVRVSKKVSNDSIYLTMDSNIMYVNEVANLITVVTPDEKLLSKVVYSSSDASKVSVTSNGKVVAKREGKATITARIASEGISASIDVIVEKKAVEDIYLSSTNLTLKVNDNYRLETSFYPVDAKSNVTYTSSNSNVASVDSKGNIKALKEGLAVITVKSNNHVSEKCLVEVKKKFNESSGIDISIDKTNINIGERAFVSALVEPSNSYNKNVTYTSSDSGIAKVFNDGSVLGVSEGNVVITVTNASGISENISLKVNKTNINIEKITLDSYITLESGTSRKIKTSIYPSGANSGNMVWSSLDSTIAKVDSRGVVTGVRDGSTTITVTSGNVSSSVVVKVTEVKAESLVLNYDELNLLIGNSVDLKTNIMPTNTTNLDVSYISLDEDVVKVDNNGRVKALKEGKTDVIVVSKSNPSVKSKCSINVSKVDVESFKLSHDQVIVEVGKEVKLSTSNIKPSHASYKNAKYDVLDKTLASVDNGVIKGISVGNTKITVVVDGISKTIDLTVVPKGDKVYFIDTYSSVSDAILLESNGKYALIDTGSNASSIKTIKFLKDLGVKKLDFILITHFHGNNFGGIYGENPTNNILLSDIKVDKLYMKPYSGSDSYFLGSNKNLLNDREDIIDRRVMKNEMYVSIKDNATRNNVSFITLNTKNNILNLGNFKLDLYNLQDQLKSYSSKCLEKRNCNENSNSIVVYAKVNGKGIYLASDIYNAYHSDDTKYLKTKTEEEISKIISKEYSKNVDIYKASNHGDSSSNVTNALKNINPKYSIITNSKNNINNTSGIDRIKKYTKNDIYYSLDGTVVANIDSKGNISFIQMDD